MSQPQDLLAKLLAPVAAPAPSSVATANDAEPGNEAIKLDTDIERHSTGPVVASAAMPLVRQPASGARVLGNAVHFAMSPLSQLRGSFASLGAKGQRLDSKFADAIARPGSLPGEHAGVLKRQRPDAPAPMNKYVLTKFEPGKGDPSFQVALRDMEKGSAGKAAGPPCLRCKEPGHRVKECPLDSNVFPSRQCASRTPTSPFSQMIGRNWETRATLPGHAYVSVSVLMDKLRTVGHCGSGG